MKVVFLDFDGVLNTVRTPSPSGNYIMGSVHWLAAQIERRFVERVNRITDATGAVVVLSTSWRNAHPLPKLVEMLSVAGLRAPVIGATWNAQRLSHGRDVEIEKWVAATGLRASDFIVLDDFFMARAFINERHIHTDVGDGLTEAQTQQAIRMLNSSDVQLVHTQR